MEKKHIFTTTEKKELLKILQKYASIIENKSTDGDTSRRKNIAWSRIACEYNTSSIAPYPASGKQLRRLWMNLKQRHKMSLDNSDQNPEQASNADLQNEETLAVTDTDEEIRMPCFVNVAGGDIQDSLGKTQIATENSQTGTFIATDSEGRAFDVEFIDDMEEEVKPTKHHSPADIELHQIKKSILKREYQDRKRRQDELHVLQKRLLIEQIKEARAKANLAELELKDHKYLD